MQPASFKYIKDEKIAILTVLLDIGTELWVSPPPPLRTVVPLPVACFFPSHDGGMYLTGYFKFVIYQETKIPLWGN